MKYLGNLDLGIRKSYLKCRMCHEKGHHVYVCLDLVGLHKIVSNARCEKNAGIFARRAMVDQVHQCPCYQLETYYFSVLNIKRIRLFWLNVILYLENCAVLILLLVDHIENDFGIFVVLSHGKLDRSFFFIAGLKSL